MAGDESSVLFAKVRESLGAAYAIEATNFSSNSIFLINAGLDPEKVDEAKKIIQTEIKNVQNGNIDQEVFKKAKKALVRNELIGNDRESFRVNRVLHRELTGITGDRLSLIKRSTISQMQDFARNLVFKESYCVK